MLIIFLGAVVQASLDTIIPPLLRYTTTENPLAKMSLDIGSLPCVLTQTRQSRGKFLKRLFLKNDSTTELCTWENTASQLAFADIPEAFLTTNEKFVDFLNEPSRELFAEWSGALEDTLQASGVIDDWNASAVFMALMTARYRDLNIPEYGPILPLENVDEVIDSDLAYPTFGFCARKFATVVLAIASAARKRPHMSAIAEELLGEAEAAEEDDCESDEA